MTIQSHDRITAIFLTLAGLFVITLLGWLLLALLVNGLAGLSLDFLLTAPSAGGSAGGIGPILISTFWVLAICLLAAVPIGLGTAMFLSECVDRDNWPGRWLGYSLDVLAGVPSIVFALFGYQFFAITLGFGFSILAGGLTLACMVLPLLIRTSEQALRAVPLGLRQSGAALALSHVGMLRRVLLPAAAGGISAAIILSIGRALAETAVLLFTAGYVMRLPGSMFDSGRTLSVHVYDLAMHVPGGMANAASTALVLFILIIIINLGVRRLLNHPA